VSGTGTKRIVIVDDQRLDSGVIHAATLNCLVALNWSSDIRIAESRAEATSIMKTFPPDLLITDLFMPIIPSNEPPKKFADLPLEVQCNEMEWPQGIALLESSTGTRVTGSDSDILLGLSGLREIQGCFP
jgi:CheY-like chemotaxis protein